MATPLTSGWVERGLCRTHPDPEMWFPRRHDNGTAFRAKAICAQCPVRDTCLYEALSVDDTYGIWGGSDEDDRSNIRRKTGAWSA